MEKAFSLVKHKLFSANSAEYRQNIGEQLVCPSCYEQVFKKKLWVVSRQAHTHYFSHYFGEPDSCPERTSGEGSYENSKDQYAQMQRLQAFNQAFRQKIIEALAKIIGKQALNKLASAVEFAERICTNNIPSGQLEKIELALMKGLDDPITSTIDEDLAELEEAILPIYWHFKSKHGQSNLRYISCATLLMIFHKEYSHLEKILEKKTLSLKPNFNSLLLGNAVLLLANSEYVDWQYSTKPILKFLEPEIQKKQSKKAQTSIRIKESKFDAPGYFPCIYCKKIHFFECYMYKECDQCHKWFYTDPEIKLKNSKGTPLKKGDLIQENMAEDSTSPRWIYCLPCNKHYYSDKKTSCPHEISKAISSRKIKEDQEKLIKCSKCRANFLGYRDGCPYCSKNPSTQLRNCRSCGKGLIKTALLPSRAGNTWRKCNFCNLNFEYKNF